MPTREQDDLVYRSPVRSVVPSKEVTPNEDEFSTLRRVRQLLAESVDGLSKDFNAFDVLKTGPEALAAADLLRQIQVNQGVYDIVAPLLDAVNSAMQVVDQKYKQ